MFRLMLFATIILGSPWAHSGPIAYNFELSSSFLHFAGMFTADDDDDNGIVLANDITSFMVTADNNGAPLGPTLDLDTGSFFVGISGFFFNEAGPGELIFTIQDAVGNSASASSNSLGAVVQPFSVFSSRGALLSLEPKGDSVPAPAPATLALLGLGLAGLRMQRRKRK